MAGHPPFDVEIVTPDGTRFEGSATALRLPGADGLFGVLARHAPMLAVLDVGIMDLAEAGGAERKFAVGEGFVEVTRQRVRVLTDFADRPEEIDVERARAAQHRAEERLARPRDAAIDVARAEVALRRALVRLRLRGVL